MPSCCLAMPPNAATLLCRCCMYLQPTTYETSRNERATNKLSAGTRERGTYGLGMQCTRRAAGIKPTVGAERVRVP